jgi:hypothetical protein
MFDEVSHAVFFRGLIAGTGIDDYSAMRDKARNPLMDEPYAVIKCMKMKVHYQ